MSRLLRAAMEGDLPDGSPNPSEPPIEIKGPLSDAFTKALQTAYAKTPDGSVATESQAQDFSIMQHLITELERAEGYTGDAPVVVYAVQADQMDQNDYVEITNDLATNDHPENIVVVMDATDPSVDGGQYSGEVTERLVTLEALAVRCGAKCFRGLGAFIKSF